MAAPTAEHVPSAFPFLEGEEIRHAQPHTSLYTGAHPVPRVGTLLITTRCVLVAADEVHLPAHRGVPSLHRRVALASAGEDGSILAEFLYPDIGLHAICSEPQDFPHPCIYCQLHVADALDGSQEEAATEEIRLVPLDKESLHVVFETMAECTSLFPDDGEDSDEGDDDEGLAGNPVQFSAEQQAMLDHFDAVLQLPPGEPGHVGAPDVGDTAAEAPNGRHDAS